MKAGADFHVLDVVIHYRLNGEVHSLRFGRHAEEPVPCSIFFDHKEMQTAKEALGVRSEHEVPASGWSEPEVMGHAVHGRLEAPEVERLGLTEPRAITGGGRAAICWHSCLCDWWCLEDLR